MARLIVMSLLLLLKEAHSANVAKDLADLEKVHLLSLYFYFLRTHPLLQRIDQLEIQIRNVQLEPGPPGDIGEQAHFSVN